jgi:pimeloyl-ACP methyl ester carboxylesterase
MSPLLQHRGVMGAAPLLRPVLEASVADPEAMPDRLVARYLAPFVGKDGVSQLLTLARSVRAQDLDEDELRAIRSPAMIVVGEKDRWLSIRAAERLAGMLPESRLERIEGAGRLIPEEEPDRLAELLLSFVGSV